SLSFAASLSHRLGEVRENNSEPKPDRYLQAKSVGRFGKQQIQRSNGCTDFGDEHYRILPHIKRIELLETLDDCGFQDFRIEQSTCFNRHRFLELLFARKARRSRS